MSRSRATAVSDPSSCGSTDTPSAMRSTASCAIAARWPRLTSASSSSRTRSAWACCKPSATWSSTRRSVRPTKMRTLSSPARSSATCSKPLMKK